MCQITISPGFLFSIYQKQLEIHSSFFDHAIGAIDGTHFDCSPSKDKQHAAHDCKGKMTQNCLAVCDFDLKFRYIFSGWDGSASNSYIFHDAQLTDFTIPVGKYFLADVGFPICEGLLIPYRGVCYHLQEWGHINIQYVQVGFFWKFLSF